MQRNPALGYTPIGLLDDDPRKRNLRLHGVRVLGTVADLEHVVRDRRPDEILIAIPSASGELRARIVETARPLHVPVKTLPSLSDLVSGDRDLARQLRPVEVEDVLGREPVSVDLASISDYLADEVVLVTGAGGSIGSELCRQIARLRPAKLVLLDNAEPALFEIERELVRDRGFLAAAAVVGDVKDAGKLRQVFDKYRPGVVFHAAAYKHVALMEANPVEAVRNNTLGTRVVADVAAEYGAKRFVLVSTDKAANPKTVMGQSKALAEWIVETWGHRADVTTRFVAVRFGNVLGSSGSVVPIFRRQIARGGPVTVTHPEMTRFFMTIPEAVQLIVQAGAIGGRGQVYVLDMGEPVRIVDLAEKMIRLSGKEPGTEIAIEFIGPAPGEKLHEELVGAGETASPSAHPKIDLISRPPIDPDWLESELARARAARGGRRDARARRRAAARRGRAEARAHGRDRLVGVPAPLFAVGDVHGHRDVLAALLRDAGLVDPAERWSGGDAVVWLVGDLVDRGPDGIGAIDLVRRLERESDGAVHCLLGNHEALLLAVHRFGDVETSYPGDDVPRRVAHERRASRPTSRALAPEHVEWVATLPRRRPRGRLAAPPCRHDGVPRATATRSTAVNAAVVGGARRRRRRRGRRAPRHPQRPHAARRPGGRRRAARALRRHAASSTATPRSRRCAASTRTR